MFKELNAEPNCEMVVATHEFSGLRISGAVEFTDSIELKQQAIDSNELVKTYMKLRKILHLKCSPLPECKQKYIG
ncbi:hypothetical protein [Methanobrevibacter millerae]|uniref:hypothetical protein n=1 Tax=Methanobrevibacter millerae TaxID=230361 RepID=UPI001CB7418E|nr:hypothetical protein [Methanobrevibacter millerae]